MTTSNEHPLAGSSDPAARTAGIILIASSVLAVLFMAHHPTAETHDAAALAADIGGKASLSRFVHGGLIALLAAQLFAFTVFCRWVGAERGAVGAGLVAYAIGTGAMIGAALISGFVVSDLATHYAHEAAGDSQAFMDLLRISMTGNQALAKLGVITMSIAIVLWAFALFRTHRPVWVAIVGLLAGLVPAVALATGLIHLDVAGMLLVVIAETVWNLSVGVLLVRATR
jgi:hypothetical protein